ncbi:MAG: divalent metal cation transporter [Candidatus Dormibacteraeota bacterium]|uniref:Divalent metal cation transporter n=1 Tax=Candidatus Dormiibacter inghamiae TaxID=3127013 RepID=A0A934KGC4_9BACT|nr:divalent metal cation transporter [Candidatus Dormibacteraeota bacterium]MBJ7604976.1 divalent metal cation transporter [Candidatus Dormibacteraeota bacterium]
MFTEAEPALGAGSLSPEDLQRSHDRLRVLAARHRGRRLPLLWLLAGPGLLVMLGENDGPSMLSYAASGATYGVGFFLPFIGVTFLGAIVVQEMAMRVGAVTHRGYGELVFQRFGRFWGWFSAVDLLVTNFVTLITEFIAIRVGSSFFGVPAWLSVLAGLLLVGVSLAGGRYWRWERAALGLAAFNLLFLLAAVLSKPDPGAIASAFATWQPLPTGSLQTFLLLVASNVGATVTPWMLFFQQSAVVDKGLTPRDIGQGRLDTLLGGLLAFATGCGALLVAAALFSHHIPATTVQGGAGFAEALRPVSGYPVAALFSLGLVEAGALAILTISASTAYAVGEVMSGPHSFNRRLRDAPSFYGFNLGLAILAAAVVLLPGAPLLAITLNANLLATVLMPAALVFLLVLANDREIMGSRVNPRLLNWAAAGVALMVALAGTSYAVVAFVNAVTGRAG